jgi:hypothetical protein
MCLAPLFAVIDQSWLRCRALVSASLPSLPDIHELGDVLAAAPPAKIPVLPPAMVQLAASGQQGVPLFEADNGSAYQLAFCITSALTLPLHGLEQEPFTADAVNVCIVRVLLTMDQLLVGTGLELGLTAWRDRADKGVFVTLNQLVLYCLQRGDAKRRVCGANYPVSHCIAAMVLFLFGCHARFWLATWQAALAGR